ncbi:sulfatase, partial [Candidatus Bathyarchaeota archaeon]
MEPDRMNVIVLMEDSLRKDHLGCYGNKWIKTPNIDKFASDSIIFDFAYAEGLPTIPVRVAMLTGRYTLPFRGWQPLEQLDMVLPEILWDKGVTTALISDTYHMHKPQMGFSRGFDYVEWIRGQESDPWIVDPDVKVDLSKYSEKNWHPAYFGQPPSIVKRQFMQYLKNRAHWKSEEDHHIAQVIKSSIRWLEDKVSNGKRDRLFLMIDSFDPHEPWDPPSEYLDLYPVPEYDGLPITWGGGSVEDWTLAEIRHVRAQYAGTVTLCDKWTGMLFEKIDELGLLENTAIIFLSDHGEPLGEHGIIKKVRPWPYDELSHIPFIIRLPDKMGLKGKRIGSFVGVQDLAPTVLKLFEIDVPKIMQGRDLLPVIQDKEEGKDFEISGFHGRSWSIRDKEWSFYLWLGPRMAGAKEKPEL